MAQAQLARLADRRAALYGAGVPFLAVLVPPLPAQALLALATSADVVLAEPGVGESGITTEALQEAGLVDRVVSRDLLKAELSRLVNLLLPD